MVRIAVVWLIVLGSHARADDAPWAKNVGDVQIKQAETLLAEGNTLFVEKRYADALERYTKAIASWDHPAIRFNMVRCLIQLGRNFEAFDNIVLALRYGPKPLEKDIYEEALNYKKLLERQVAEISVTCTQAGVRVTLDGQPLVDCPGQRTKRVEPGDHQVVGTRAGFVASTNALVIVGGTKKTVAVELAPLAPPTHRWKPWKPWAVAIGGVATVALGTGLKLLANREFDLYAKDVARLCGDTGCNDDGGGKPPVPRDHERRGELLDKLAIATWITGIVVVGGGGALVYLNRSKPSERMRVALTPATSGCAMTIERRF
jgi:hypothetical protein